ncbi:MAG: hypothetical protein AVO35_12500 [Candidatus Aegiribacteria sp. MLS_C]|nr:MAG: hypothetical protein AVO35_12500 [Candidatus Aegiribacteria sp. MLS_C]
MKRTQLFISYASQDRKTADHVVSFFESRGIGCWIAPRDIPPAADWAESIIDGIDSSSCMVLLLSRHSNRSPQVRREVERAVNNGIGIFPVVIEEIELSKWMQYYISPHQWRDATDVPLDRRLSELLDPLRKELSLSTGAPCERELSELLENDLAAISSALDYDAGEGSRIMLNDERRMVTVLSVNAELRGEDIPSAVRATVARSLNTIIERYLDHFGGASGGKSHNSYRCVFGLVHAQEDHGKRALDCGISLLKALSSIDSTLGGREMNLAFGLGAASGMIDVDPSAEERVEPRGEVLEQAAELSGIASGSLLATETVRNALRDEYTWKSHSEGVYRLARRHSAVPGARILRIQSPFVGREKELERLTSLLERQRCSSHRHDPSSASHLVMCISGDAGIGKSRLVHEFIEQNRSGDEIVLRGQTLSFAQPPFWLWTTLLRHALDIEHGSRIDYRGFLDRLEDYDEDGILDDSAPFLAELLSIPSGDRRMAELDRKAIELETRIAFRGLIEVLADGKILLVILDDLQWMDDSDLGVLEFILDNLDTEFPVLFVLIARPEREDGSAVEFESLGNHSSFDRMELTEVDQEASTELVRKLLSGISDRGSRMVASDVVEFLLNRSGGNPFYLQELVLDLVESGSLTELEQEWRFATPIGEIFVPDTITGLLQSRLDRLPESWRNVLQHSSVLGMEFQLRLYHKLAEKLFLGRAKDEVFEGLEERKMLLQTGSPIERSYAFRHVLIHDTAYSSIHEINLKLLHKVAAESIEELLPNETDRISGILMHHYQKAELDHKAIMWGFRAMENYMGEEALKLSYSLEELLNRQKDDRQLDENLFKLLSGREQVLDILGDRTEQKNTVRRMIDLAERTGSDYRMAVALKKRGNLERVTGAVEEAGTSWKRALELARKAGNRAFEGIVLGNLGALSTNQGRMDEAEDFYTKALEIHQEAGDLRSEGVILGNLGILFKTRGLFDEARSYYEQALEIARRVGDRRSIADVHNNLGSLLWSRGDLDEAGEYYEKSLVRQREIGNRRSTGIIEVNLGILRMSQGRFDESFNHFRRSLEAIREIGDRFIEGSILGNLGVLYAEKGSTDEAVENYLQALKIHREVGNRISEGIILGNLGNAYMKLERYDTAHSHYEMALEVDRETKNLKEVANVLANLGCLLISIDVDTGKALECYTEALTIASDLKLDRDSLKGLAELHDRLVASVCAAEDVPLPAHWDTTGEA